MAAAVRVRAATTEIAVGRLVWSARNPTSAARSGCRCWTSAPPRSPPWVRRTHLHVRSSSGTGSQRPARSRRSRRRRAPGHRAAGRPGRDHDAERCQQRPTDQHRRLTDDEDHPAAEQPGNRDRALVGGIARCGHRRRGAKIISQVQHCPVVVGELGERGTERDHRQQPDDPRVAVRANPRQTTTPNTEMISRWVRGARMDAASRGPGPVSDPTEYRPCSPDITGRPAAVSTSTAALFSAMLNRP